MHYSWMPQTATHGWNTSLFWVRSLRGDTIADIPRLKYRKNFGPNHLMPDRLPDMAVRLIESVQAIAERRHLNKDDSVDYRFQVVYGNFKRSIAASRKAYHGGESIKNYYHSHPFGRAPIRLKDIYDLGIDLIEDLQAAYDRYPEEGWIVWIEFSYYLMSDDPRELDFQLVTEGVPKVSKW